MNKMIKARLKTIINETAGKLLVIGLNDSSLLSQIKNNDEIITCDILNNNNYSKVNYENNSGKTKNINLKNIRKIFGHKKLNKIICDYQHVEGYLKTFIKDSIFITNDSVVIYGDLSSAACDSLVAKYRRYHVEAEIEKSGNYQMIIFKVGSNKTNIIKDRYYYICDSFKEIGEIISDILVG